MEHNQLILSAKDVHIQFNLRGKVLHAIRGIDLDLYQGEVLAIVGESGSGKSVFTKSFMGLLDANGSITEGTIDYYGMAGRPKRTGCGCAAGRSPWSCRTP
jgi:oligopeptide transport system ATP-binding protein